MFTIFKPRVPKVRLAVVLIIGMSFTFYFFTARNYEHVLPLRSLGDVRLFISSLLGRTASSDVRVFSTDHYNCTYLLPFRLFNRRLSQICSYNPYEDLIAKTIKANQGFESNLVDDIMLALEDAQRLLRNRTHAGDENPKVSLVDLGSNIGVFTLTAASAGYEVLAVDAMKETLQLLATTLHLAGLTSRVTLLNNAISDVRGNVSMDVDKHNFGGSKVNQEMGSGQDGGGKANISAIHMNDLIPYVRSRHVVIKMDIQGFEENALQSGGDFFEKIDVYSVLIEWFFQRAESGARIIHFMKRRGFMPYTNSSKKDPLDPRSHALWPSDVVFIK